MATASHKDPPHGQSQDRIHALDAVRGGALLLGVGFHATLAYVSGAVAAVHDQTSLLLTAFAFSTHSFRMALFFVVAGFFARMMLERRGPGGFTRNRAIRIALPFLVFWPLSLAAMQIAFRWGATVDQHPLDPLWPSLNLVSAPLTHLWFLYCLTLIYVAALIVDGAARRLDGAAGKCRAVFDRLLHKLVSWRLAAPALALPLTIVFARAEGWNAGIGIPTPDHGFIPHLIPMCAYAASFTVGWFLQRQPALLGLLQRQWALHLVVATVVSGLLFIPLSSGVGLSLDLAGRLVEGGLYALSIWCWTFGLMGLALRFLGDERPVVRYLADASYWIYIVHLPLVFGLQVLVFPLHWTPLAKFALVLSAALALALASYQVMVRYTWLGAWLNGRRVHPSRSAAKRASAEGQA